VSRLSPETNDIRLNEIILRVVVSRSSPGLLDCTTNISYSQCFTFVLQFMLL
jgi:hypothetical protein